VGAFDFASDLLTAYANVLAGTNRYRFKPLNVGRLPGRGALPLGGWQLFRWAVRRLPSVPALWRWFRRKPAPLIPHRPSFEETAPPLAFPEACVHHFCREESAALAALAQGSETSLNSFLARDLILALDHWRGQNNLPAGDCLRLMLPISMRSPGDRRMPAANVVSTAYLDHFPADEPDDDHLLHRIHRLMEDIKHDNLGLAWLLALRLLERMPRAWGKARRSRRRCMYSALFTNIGPVLAASPLPRADRHLVVGDTVLEEVEFLPVTRPLQCLGVAVTSYAGRMSVGMRYDSRVLKADQVQQIMNTYVDRLRASCGFVRRKDSDHQATGTGLVTAAERGHSLGVK
jgi:hypothetical protein